VAHHIGTSLNLPLECIQPNPDNPRRAFDERALDELADSIRSWGQLQPVVVRRVSDSGSFQLICGERRWRAHQRAGLPTIWALERDATDADVLRLALIENLQRVSLARAEKLAALDQLAELTQVSGLRRTAAELGVDASWLSRQLAVRRDPTIFPALEAGQLGFGQAAELLRAPRLVRQSLLERIINAPSSVPTGTVRAWVEAARAREQLPERTGAARATVVRDESGQVTGPALDGSYRHLLDQLIQLGPPRSREERAALRELLDRGRHLLEPRPVPSVTAPRNWVELNCLLCGERAATVENGRIQERAPGALRRQGRQMQCGRCGGALAQGERGVSYTYHTPLVSN
jgi:ParB/RepB/Spo0J family partition protein